MAVCCCKGFAQLVEQPRVLDRDHRLGGEIGHQFNLLVGKWCDLLTIDPDHADQCLILEHRDYDDGASAAKVGDGDDRRITFVVGR